MPLLDNIKMPQTFGQQMAPKPSPKMDLGVQQGVDPTGQPYPIEDWMTRSGSGVVQTPLIDPAVDLLSLLFPEMLSKKAFARLGSETGALGRALRVPEKFSAESAVKRPFTGRPIRVYHGTTNEFLDFDMAKSKEGLYGPGIYFTENPAVAGGSVAKGPIKGKLGYSQGTGQLAKALDYEQAIANETATIHKTLARLKTVPPVEDITGGNPLNVAADDIKLFEKWAAQNEDALRNFKLPTERPNVRPAYLNIREPLYIDAKTGDEKLKKRVLELYEKQETAGGYLRSNRIRENIKNATNEQLYNYMGQHLLGMNLTNVNKTLMEMGYDGITHLGGDKAKHRVWIAFDPAQVISSFEK